jgi:hypothetical protein
MAKAKRRAKATRAKAKKTKTKAAAKSAARARARKPQRFTVSHHRDEDFDYGLRPYSAYRDLGIAKATDGMVQAHVIRMTKPFRAEEVAIPHYHDVDFQMVYVLKGWFSSEFEGQASIHSTPVRAGSNRQRSSTPSVAIPTIASCWRSCCRRISGQSP